MRMRRPVARLAAPPAGRFSRSRQKRPASGAAERGWVAGAALLLCLAPLLGCSTPRGIPMGAQLVTEATVKSSFQAPTDGMLWIYRSPARGSRAQLHYSGPIGAGQVLVIDPAMNKATVDGQELEIVLPGGDVWYQAYFQADSSVRKVLATRPPGRRTTDEEGRGYRELEPRDGPATDQQETGGPGTDSGTGTGGGTE